LSVGALPAALRRDSPNAPAGHALNVAFHHQPSRMLRLGTPFSAAFMPLVPEASKGKLRRVEPEVHSGSYLPAKLEIVIVEENHVHHFPQRFFRLENPPNDVLPAPVIRMRLAGIHDLEVTGVLGNLPETIENRARIRSARLYPVARRRNTDREGSGST